VLAFVKHFSHIHHGNRLYNNTCGELIYYNDDFEGLDVGIWYSGSSIEQFGVWTQQGVWIVRVSNNNKTFLQII